MKNKDEAVFTCQSMELAAMDVLGDLTSNPDLLNVPAYKLFAEKVYMAARQAATLSRVCGDPTTAKHIDSICDKIVKKANL